MTHENDGMTRRGLFAAAGGVAGALALGPEVAATAAEPTTPKGAPVSLVFEPMVLKLRHTWTIARGSSDEKRNGLLTLSAEGVTGYGEAAANVRWKQSYDTAEAAFQRVKRAVAGLSPWDHRTWLERAEAEAGSDHEVVSALDMALWDWKGKRLGQSVWRLLGVSEERMPPTTFSIGIDTPEVMKEKTREAAPYPRLKVKLGQPNDEENVAAVRAVTDKPITVDANEGWKTVEEARRKIEWLNQVKPLYLEQPMPSSMDAEMAALTELASFPILADESFLSAKEIPPLAGRFDGIVIKLDKCGGVTRAYESVVVARALGLRAMLGCMIESSLAIAAAVAVAPLFDWVDLDGNLLLADDPWTGLVLREGRWRLPSAPGLGVSRARNRG